MARLYWKFLFPLPWAQCCKDQKNSDRISIASARKTRSPCRVEPYR
ncbi:MAG: hypothetical protein ACOC0N_06415 [Chroococcales cyanobacterium]